MKSEQEELNRTLLFPCQRTTWDFDGETHSVEVTAFDSAAERTWRSKRVLEAYDWYQPVEFHGFLIHNEEVRELLPEACTLSGLEKLRDRAEAKGLFKAKFDNGLAVTSTARENRNMNVNRWITDSIHNLALVKDDEQKDATVRLLASFYCTPTEQAAFIRVIEKPWLFRNPDDAKEGVAHIFQIEKIEGKMHLKRDPKWANNKRLESHGLALRTFCDFLLRHLPKGASAEDAICKAIASLGLYFQAIDYLTAPSAGAWEEIPLPGGLSWDTEAIRQGLAALEKLMFGTADTAVKSYREVIRGSACRLASLAKQTGSDMLFTDKEVLNELIRAGSRQIRLRVRQKAEAPGMRSRDASLAFLAQSDLDLSDSEDPHERAIETARLYMELLDDLEFGLVRRSGMIRYEPFACKPGGERGFFDSYLTVNYWLGFDEDGYFNPVRTRLVREFGSSDASNPEVLKNRTKLAVREREAEWFLVTEMARGYAKQAQRVRASARQSQRQEALELFERCKDKACEYLKRGYARITPNQPENLNAVKANGEDCHPWELPEAYEWVRIRANAVDKGEAGFVERTLPGANTSLAWAAASLKMATEEARMLLLPEEAVHAKGRSG
ncbi:MAG: hypothetical protein GY862_33560 [Gammaproteobacteria bacterium]|nr:hypothetical protein [Gammaproteobacteria bacterium]